eukprot:scaffold40081_cov32-Tisochrysis_lutea.AAC.9
MVRMGKMLREEERKGNEKMSSGAINTGSDRLAQGLENRGSHLRDALTNDEAPFQLLWSAI